MPVDDEGNEIPIEDAIREVDPEAFSPFFGGPAPDLPDDDETVDDDTTDQVDDEPNVLTLPNGKKLSVEQLESLSDFNDFISTNPSAWGAVQKALQTPPVFGAPTTPPVTTPNTGVPVGGGYPATLPPPTGSQQETIPEDIAADPTMLAMWQRTQAAEQRVARFEQQYEQQSAAQRNAQLQASLSTARQKFGQDFQLDEKQMEKLLWHVADANVATAFVAANPNDPTSALYNAMEVTFYRTPTFRDAYIQQRDEKVADEQKKSTQRKRKASSLSGGTGTSAPRNDQPVKARGEQEKRDILAGAIRQIRAASE
jgi:hypothetical protein